MNIPRTAMPLSAKIDLAKGLIEPYKKHNVVRLSDLREYFSDREQVEKVIATSGDVVVYEYFETGFEADEVNINFGMTIMYPGKVGREYFLTRGHFHERPAPEIYFGLEGDGIILMQSETGDVEWRRLEPNSIVYVPPGWGHRTINTGNKRLVFFFAYPSNAGHDYEIVRKKGFAKLVVEENGVPVLIDNPKYGV